MPDDLFSSMAPTRVPVALAAHPASAIFPMMAESDIAALAADIEANGLREPIVLLDGMILDGRNRYLACERAQIEPEFVTYGAPDSYADIEMADSLSDSRLRSRAKIVIADETLEYEEEALWADYLGEMPDPVAFVVSRNLHRRHLTESQRAMVAAKIATMSEGRPSATAQISAVSQTDAAGLLGVSRGSVQSAAIVRREGVPELVDAVESGEVAVSAAAGIARKPEAEQRDIIKRPTASAARKQARDSGQPVIARDGREYDGRTLEEERASSADTELFFGVIGALEALNAVSVSPGEYIARLPDDPASGRYLDELIDEHLDAAATWLREFSELWEGHRGSRKVA